ncbi:hypothetical protein Rhal01_02609 [Rubritalea halochordaticola]|uniref:Sulfatase-modifying factor enzyme domain-containing protein n=1 Tax=Rubritalea halochordaticola TaxID=714537 RepID=A0ABP9V158_9BACT
MKRISTTFLLLVTYAQVSMGQVQELQWGEFGCYSNWERIPYKTKSEYEFIGRLPDLREFPKLLEVALDPKLSNRDISVLTSQLRTLSRCDFETSLNPGSNAEYQASIAKWKAWWDAYGSKMPEALAQRGQSYEKAWQQVAPSPHLEVPNYPILIPKSWSSTLSFRSGDYGGITEEVIEFRVSEDACSLRRRYRTGWMGKQDWTHEVWQDFTREEADHFLACLTYLIDNPWFFSRDELSEKADGKDQAGISHIKGRPKAWTDYYPNCEWTGILDSNQNVLINHDPWHWDSMDHDLGPKTSLDEPFGIVFRLVRDVFPDPSWDPDSSRWKRTEPDPNKKKEPADPEQPATPPESKSNQ